MAPRSLTAVLAMLAVVALFAGCGREEVELDSYTCGEFERSFRDKDDTSAGNFIRQISDKVKKRPGAGKDAVQQQVGASIAIACGGKPDDFEPANAAIALVNRANSGKPPEQPKTETDDDTSPEPETTEDETTTEP